MVSQSKRELKKNEILQSGIALLWERGCNGVSVKDIVEAAGIPKGSFYFYFESKEDFVVQALENYSAMADDLTAGILEDDGLSPLARLRKFYEVRGLSLRQQNCQKGCMLTNISSEMAGQNAPIREVAEDAFAGSERPVADCLRAAARSGELSLDVPPEELAEFLESTWRGISVTAKVKQDPQVVDRTIEFFFQHLLTK